ncbi:MAG: hypothetical protein QOG04_2176 [Actinomycetota bacterium]|nr:hypothetical protein [Actinomycetota bacterium]
MARRIAVVTTSLLLICSCLSAPATALAVTDTPNDIPTCFGEPATVVGTSRADTLEGTVGSDVIVTFSGADWVNARGGKDLLCLGSGGDHAEGGRGLDRIRGGRGEDDLFGDGGGSYLFGGRGNDHFFGGRNQDRIWGGRGDDDFNLSLGHDVAHGGHGAHDWLGLYDSRHGVTVNLKDGTLKGGTADVISGIEDVQGSRFADRLVGNARANYLRGASGDDVIVGRRGRDRIGGFGGHDLLHGGAGKDSLAGRGGEDLLDGGKGLADNLWGGKGNDSCVNGSWMVRCE